MLHLHTTVVLNSFCTCGLPVTFNKSARSPPAFLLKVFSATEMPLTGSVLLITPFSVNSALVCESPNWAAVSEMIKHRSNLQQSYQMQNHVDHVSELF